MAEVTAPQLRQAKKPRWTQQTGNGLCLRDQRGALVGNAFEQPTALLLQFNQALLHGQMLP